MQAAATGAEAVVEVEVVEVGLTGGATQLLVGALNLNGLLHVGAVPGKPGLAVQVPVIESKGVRAGQISG